LRNFFIRRPDSLAKEMSPVNFVVSIEFLEMP
jgi:hypothetical protein